MGKEDHKFMETVKLITWELQHDLIIVDMDKKQKRKTEWKPGSQKTKCSEVQR